MPAWQNLVVALGVLAAIVVVVAVRLGRRTPDDNRRRETKGSDVASGMLGEMIEIFQPSRTTLTEERERIRHDKQQTGASAPPFGVDLDAGTAVLPCRTRPDGAANGGASPAGTAPGPTTPRSGG